LDFEAQKPGRLFEHEGEVVSDDSQDATNEHPPYDVFEFRVIAESCENRTQTCKEEDHALIPELDPVLRLAAERVYDDCEHHAEEVRVHQEHNLEAWTILLVEGEVPDEQPSEDGEQTVKDINLFVFLDKAEDSPYELF
jgi:hypothetical protein